MTKKSFVCEGAGVQFQISANLRTELIKFEISRGPLSLDPHH